MKTNLKLKEKNEQELKDLLVEKREALRATRFGTSSVRDTLSARKSRKDVARIMTEMNARKTA